MRKSIAFLLAVGSVSPLGGRTSWAQQYEKKQQVELKLSNARVERFDFEQNGIETDKHPVR